MSVAVTPTYAEAAHEILKPPHVRLHHLPDWFRRCVLEAIREGRLPKGRYVQSSHQVLQHLQGCLPMSFLDHWGSCRVGETTAFVCEPYLSVAMVFDAKMVADILELQLDISPNSEWFPGRTTRIIFLPTEELPRP